MSSIRIAETAVGAKTRLAELERTYRLAGWERAAIVWAHTRGMKEGRPPKETVSTDTVSREAIAERLGVSISTIARAREAWKWAMADANAPDVKPGETVSLPTVQYPPTGDGGARDERGDAFSLSDPEEAEPVVREYIAKNPEVVRAATMAFPAVAAMVADTVADSPQLQEDVERRVIAKRLGISSGRVAPAMGPASRNRDKELAEHIYAVNMLLREERDGD